jgi:hypothetical protein
MSAKQAITAKLLALDERDDLPPEEEALAEVLTLLNEDSSTRTSGPCLATRVPPLKCSAAGVPSTRRRPSG